MLIVFLFHNIFLRQNKLIVGLIFPCLKSAEMFALNGEPEVLIPDFTMEEIAAKVTEIFDQKEIAPVESKSVIVRDRTINESISPKLEPQSEHEQYEFNDDEMYDDPLQTQIC